MRNRGKVAVTIDPELLDRIEEMRKRTGESRSAVFERAIAAYVANASQAESARRYVDAYRRQPERTVEPREALATALEALAAEPYDAPR
jgi:metal-responsive CopG/Arc/MetJ family transcriptional regulator